MKSFPNFYSEDMKNFVKDLLEINPEKRPSFFLIGNYEIFLTENR